MAELPLKQKRKRNESIQIFTLRYIIWTTDPVILVQEPAILVYHHVRQTFSYCYFIAVYKGRILPHTYHMAAIIVDKMLEGCMLFSEVII